MVWVFNAAAVLVMWVLMYKAIKVWKGVGYWRGRRDGWDLGAICGQLPTEEFKQLSNQLAVEAGVEPLKVWDGIDRVAYYNVRPVKEDTE